MSRKLYMLKGMRLVFLTPKERKSMVEPVQETWDNQCFYIDLLRTHGTGD